MAHQIVDVIDRHGHVVQSYTVEIEGKNCVEAEFEEIALVLAEKSGKLAIEEHVHLRARCVK